MSASVRLTRRLLLSCDLLLVRSQSPTRLRQHGAVTADQNGASPLHRRSGTQEGWHCTAGAVLHVCTMAFLLLASGPAVSFVVLMLCVRCRAGANGGHGARWGQDVRGRCVWGAPGKWGAWYLGASLRAYLPRSSAVAPPSNALLGYLGRWVARRTLQLSPQTNPRPVVLQATPTCPLELRNAIWGLHVPSFLPDTAILAVHLHRPPRVAW